MKSETDFTATLNYFTEKEVKNIKQFNSGMRSNIKFDSIIERTSGEMIFFNNVKKMLPGETMHAYISILWKEKFSHKLHVGLRFKFFDGGSKVVGTGRITDIQNTSLKRKNNLNI